MLAFAASLPVQAASAAPVAVPVVTTRDLGDDADEVLAKLLEGVAGFGAWNGFADDHGASSFPRAFVFGASPPKNHK